ncbi:SDR family oxidoreductase [Pseudomonas sp. NPDC096917]|uniref:SDR family oxidoreductase n=1 Tax=Pseudomonas sp. NPDC096917 TaxID=3364483 RepID=UPI00383B2132
MSRERVLITGGASGIGAAIVQRCIEDGFEPVIIDRIREGILTDLSNVKATAQALEQALAGGPITRLVNNVGMVCPNSAQEQSLEELEQVWALNLRRSLQCMQALLPGMKEAGFGRILNMSSRAALGKELRSAYAATKAGLLGMTRVWSLELGRFGITANAIGPGPIRTELFERANPPDSPRTQAIIDSIPVKRLGMPDDIAQATAFLLDARSGFVTGQVLYVCGGMTVGVAGV